MPAAYACVLLAIGLLTGSPVTTVSRSVHHTSPSPFTGIGIQLRNEVISGELIVVTVVRGSPAHKKGVQVGDVITEVIREVDSWGKRLPQLEKTPTKDLGVKKAVDLILGKPKTSLRLMIRREGVKNPLAFDIERGRVKIESVFGHRRKENADWDFMIDPKSKVGYVRLSSFSRRTHDDLEAAVNDLKRQGVNGLVLDLRFNPGGFLNISLEVTDLFIDDGLIVSVRNRPPIKEEHYSGKSPGSLLDFPMACLVNGISASGSEIVASALQDHKRAKVFGERTYGKCSLQNLLDLEVTDPKTGQARTGEIKYTTATFRRPNGKNLDKSTAGKDEDWGVTPDNIIELSGNERRALAESLRKAETIYPKGKSKQKKFEDRQLEAALEYLRGQIASRASSK